MISYKDIITIAIISIMATLILIPITNTMADSIEKNAEIEVDVYTPQFNINDAVGPTTVVNNEWILEGDMTEQELIENGYTIENLGVVPDFIRVFSSDDLYLIVLQATDEGQVVIQSVIGNIKSIDLWVDSGSLIFGVDDNTGSIPSLYWHEGDVSDAKTFTLDGWTITTETVEDENSSATIEGTLVRIIPVLVILGIIVMVAYIPFKDR